MDKTDAAPVALVTGAARRIGAAIARALAGAGYAVALHCNRSRGEAEALADELRAGGAACAVVAAELGDPDALAPMLAEVRSRLGPVSLLVNNASVFELDRLDSATAESWDRHMHVNARAPVFLARLVAGQPEAPEACVVNLLDQKLFNPNPDFLSYTLSKAALLSATTALAMALAPRVRVCAVAPGLTLLSGDQTRENFARVHARTPLGRGSTPEDVARAVLYLAGARGVTGRVLLVDGGQHMVRSPVDVMFSS
jgi:NAD(P)-dependent dehydrogenase (short-subunit alcohol dehydrogenase family)